MQELYYKTYTAAIQAAIQAANDQGYETNDDDRYTEIGCGPGKPNVGATTRHTLNLYRDGEQVMNRHLMIQVYGMSQSYELNHYIQ